MYAHRIITLSGPDAYGKRTPPDRLGLLLSQITPTVRMTICMRFLGRSSPVGPRCAWLAAASDIRFVDYSGNAATALHFEAPTLGDAAPQMYEQGELWSGRPDPQFTGFDLLAEVIGEINAGNRDSDAFDGPLLGQVQQLGLVFDQHIDRLTLGKLAWTPSHPSHPAAVDAALIDAAGELRAATPQPRRVRVVGVLDTLWESRQSFSLRLSGEPTEVRGVFLEGEATAHKDLLGRQVVVEGEAVYRPSGRVLRIDAERVSAAGAEDANRPTRL
jgi:hypothetical protein